MYRRAWHYRPMDWSVRDHPQEHRYELTRGDEVAGRVEYKIRDDVMTVVHTEVDDAYEGKGLGSALLRGALDDARARELAVVPICPFTRSYLQRHPEYAELVPAERRAEFGVG